MLNMWVLHGHHPAIDIDVFTEYKSLCNDADHVRLLAHGYFVFIVGVCARRGKWLRTNAVSRTTLVTPGERRFVTIFTALCIVTCYAVWYLMEDAKAIGMNVGYGIWSLLSGPYAVSMSIFF